MSSYDFGKDIMPRFVLIERTYAYLVKRCEVQTDTDCSWPILIDAPPSLFHSRHTFLEQAFITQRNHQ